MSVEQKIRALSLKTVTNGASPAEADAAKRMIERLRSPRAADQKTEKHPQYAEGAFNSLPVSEVDWDVVAEQYLNHIQYGDYISATHSAWERYNKTRLRLDPALPLSQSDYRKLCHNTFEMLYDRKQIG